MASAPHSSVAYTRALQQSRGVQEGSFRLGRVTATVSYSRIFLRPNKHHQLPPRAQRAPGRARVSAVPSRALLLACADSDPAPPHRGLASGRAAWRLRAAPHSTPSCPLPCSSWPGPRGCSNHRVRRNTAARREPTPRGPPRTPLGTSAGRRRPRLAQPSAAHGRAPRMVQSGVARTKACGCALGSAAFSLQEEDGQEGGAISDMHELVGLPKVDGRTAGARYPQGAASTYDD